MSPEGEKEILQQLACLKTMMAEVDTKLEERQHRCNSHGEAIAANAKAIGTLKDRMSGLKAWITAAGVVGGVVGWVGHVLIGR